LLENPDSELKQDMKELAESEFKRNTSLYVDFCIMSDIGFKRQLSHLKRWLKQLIWITGHQPAEVVELSKIVINDDHSYPNRIVKKLVTHIDINCFTLTSFMQLTKALLSNKNVFSFDAGNLLISNQQIDKKDCSHSYQKPANNCTGYVSNSNIYQKQGDQFGYSNSTGIYDVGTMMFVKSGNNMPQYQNSFNNNNNQNMYQNNNINNSGQNMQQFNNQYYQRMNNSG
jgi:hypothetical protein